MYVLQNVLQFESCDLILKNLTSFDELFHRLTGSM